MTPTDPLIGAIIDGRFRVEVCIGLGGMGAVYRARQLGADRDVALKILRHDRARADEAVRRFATEARVIARLRHPHTVVLIDHGRLGDDLYLVMELVDGETLSARMARAPMQAPVGLELLAQVADALTEAHGLGIVHRDLKPGNIVIERVGDRDVARILDFGVAKVIDDEAMTLTGTVIGTPAYMAPEQARGLDIGPAADIYALGVMTYEMLTGCRPFSAGNTFALLLQHVERPPPPLAPQLPEGPGWSALAELVMSMLAKDPAARPSGAARVRDALRACAVSVSVGAAMPRRDGPPSPVGRPRDPHGPSTPLASDSTLDASTRSGIQPSTAEAPVLEAAAARRWPIPALVAFAVALGALWIGGPYPSVPASDSQRASRPWPRPLQPALIEHFTATGIPHAVGMAEKIAARLDRLLALADEARADIATRADQATPQIQDALRCLDRAESRAFDRIRTLLARPAIDIVDALPDASTPELSAREVESCRLSDASAEGHDASAMLNRLERAGGRCLQMAFTGREAPTRRCLDALVEDAEAEGAPVTAFAAQTERMIRLGQGGLASMPVAEFEQRARAAAQHGLARLAFRIWLYLSSTDGGTQAHLQAAAALSPKLADAPRQFIKLTHARFQLARRQGRYEAAAALAHASWESTMHAESPAPVSWRRFQYATALADAGRYGEALAESRAAWMLNRQRWGPTHPEQTYVGRWLADALVSHGDPAEAVAMATEAVGLLERLPIRQAIQRLVLVRALLATRQPDAVAEHLAAVEAIALGEPYLGVQRVARAWLALSRGMPARARALLKDHADVQPGRRCLIHEALDAGPGEMEPLLRQASVLFAPSWFGRAVDARGQCPAGARPCQPRCIDGPPCPAAVCVPRLQPGPR